MMDEAARTLFSVLRWRIHVNSTVEVVIKGVCSRQLGQWGVQKERHSTKKMYFENGQTQKESYQSKYS